MEEPMLEPTRESLITMNVMLQGELELRDAMIRHLEARIRELEAQPPRPQRVISDTSSCP